MIILDSSLTCIARSAAIARTWSLTESVRAADAAQAKLSSPSLGHNT
jgi:hypothetical protein